VRRNNDELVATWGNLAHRALTFAYRHFDGKVPGPGELRPADRELLDKVEASFGPIGDLLAGCKFKAAITEAMALAREANRYLDAQAPWLHIKEDRAGAATSLYVALRVIDSLKTLLCPFLPFSSQQLHESLSYEGDLLGGFRIETFHEANRSHAALVYDPPSGGATWSPSALRPGQRLREPRPLFKKLDDKIAEEELARLKQAASG
jgi:methionyl-tRNA synthetase